MAAPIVVGYDGTPGARAAGGEALRLARDLGGELVFGYCYSVSATGGEVGDLETALGEPPLKGALIGSTAHKLLHLSERPVLVVRA